MFLFLGTKGLFGKLCELFTLMLQGVKSVQGEHLISIIVEDLTDWGEFLGDGLNYFLSYHTSLEGTKRIENSCCSCSEQLQELEFRMLLSSCPFLYRPDSRVLVSIAISYFFSMLDELTNIIVIPRLWCAQLILFESV